MTFKKKVFLAIGPFLTALLIIVLLFFSPINIIQQPSEKEIHQAASSMSANMLRGVDMKRQAAESGEYLPFFGSSELSRVNPFHPSVLAKKYDREYEPYLLGAPGTQSLTHFFMLNSLGSSMEGRKIVFIISPQWFVKKGVSEAMFSHFYSPTATYDWLVHLNGNDETSRYVANRLLEFDNVQSDGQMRRLLKKVSQGDNLTSFEKERAKLKLRSLERVDLLFGKTGFQSKSEKITKQTKKLPSTYNFSELDALAIATGEEKTNNNEFRISNNFYTKRLAPSKERLKGSQKKFDYTVSPEFSDFQSFLELLAKYNIDAMFMIPPVNELWSDYTGLSTKMLDEFSRKVTYQLESQGFTNIVDFTEKRSESYFMEDTIHIGWRGWLEMDTKLQEFLTSNKKPEYHMNPELFYSEAWQKKKY